MDRISYYLQMPKPYYRWLGGLRWADNQEAIEYEDAGTFAFSSELALFLEGFAAARPLVHYGFVLHLLYLLGYGKTAPPLEALPLLYAFKTAGRPVRNAGALCAWLCREIPAVPDPPNVVEMCHRLTSSASVPLLVQSWVVDPWETAEETPLNHAAFEHAVLKELRSLSAAELEHWLRHGRGPVAEAGEQMARELTAVKPRTLAGALAALTQCERLSGAIPYVAQLVSALSLPPRRLAEEQLPTGGYSDVSTRGEPERILPSQFAMDDLEFIRRFAANELLYFRREDPLAQTREELVVLLDQGVRTWGLVRLLLSAAALAFGKLATRKKLRLLLAGTSTGGQLLDPLHVDDQAVSTLVEASDLSANPGLALERVLEEHSEAARDVVLLTHPRNLSEPDVLAAGRRAGKNTRLFGVAADANGRVQLSAMRHGTPIKLSQFLIDVATEKMRAVTRPSPTPLVGGEPLPPWQGDVEPIGFPFRFGITARLDEMLLDFDYAGEWLLAVGANHMLHACKIDGSHAEVLPRAMVNGKLVTKIGWLSGIAGGFVVVGRIDEWLIAVHYDFGSRKCTAHRLAPLGQHDAWKCLYFREYHTIVARTDTWTFAVDLATGARHLYEANSNAVNRAIQACALAQGYSIAPPWMSVDPAHFLKPQKGPALHLEESTGWLTLDGVEGPWPPFAPLADGKPMLQGCAIYKAQCKGNVLALTYYPRGQDRKVALQVFRGPDGKPLYEHRPYGSYAGFALSSDGRLLAVWTEKGLQLQVRDLTKDGALVFVTPKGRFHQRLDVELGDSWMTVQIGNWNHRLSWEHGPLELSLSIQARPNFIPAMATAMTLFGKANKARENSSRGLASYDPKRWVLGAKRDVQVVVDVFGQIAVLDWHDELVCMFFVFRQQIVAWMPDGTRYGPRLLSGGPETPNALDRIGRALREACQRGKDKRP